MSSPGDSLVRDGEYEESIKAYTTTPECAKTLNIAWLLHTRRVGTGGGRAAGAGQR